MKATTTEEVIAVLAKSQTDDLTYLHLKEHPEKAIELLNAGKPTELKSKGETADRQNLPITITYT
jgi:hypothetical protein